MSAISTPAREHRELQLRQLNAGDTNTGGFNTGNINTGWPTPVTPTPAWRIRATSTPARSSLATATTGSSSGQQPTRPHRGHRPVHQYSGDPDHTGRQRPHQHPVASASGPYPTRLDINGFPIDIPAWPLPARLPLLLRPDVTFPVGNISPIPTATHHDCLIGHSDYRQRLDIPVAGQADSDMISLYNLAPGPGFFNSTSSPASGFFNTGAGGGSDSSTGGAGRHRGCGQPGGVAVGAGSGCRGYSTTERWHRVSPTWVIRCRAGSTPAH